MTHQQIIDSIIERINTVYGDLAWEVRKAMIEAEIKSAFARKN